MRAFCSSSPARGCEHRQPRSASSVRPRVPASWAASAAAPNPAPASPRPGPVARRAEVVAPPRRNGPGQQQFGPPAAADEVPGRDRSPSSRRAHPTVRSPRPATAPAAVGAAPVSVPARRLRTAGAPAAPRGGDRQSGFEQGTALEALGHVGVGRLAELGLPDWVRRTRPAPATHVRPRPGRRGGPRRAPPAAGTVTAAAEAARCPPRPQGSRPRPRRSPAPAGRGRCPGSTWSTRPRWPGPRVRPARPGAARRSRHPRARRCPCVRPARPSTAPRWDPEPARPSSRSPQRPPSRRPPTGGRAWPTSRRGGAHRRPAPPGGGRRPGSTNTVRAPAQQISPVVHRSRRGIVAGQKRGQCAERGARPPNGWR